MLKRKSRKKDCKVKRKCLKKPFEAEKRKTYAEKGVLQLNQ